jgi:cytochrome oxidase Cu insertion factor (SCO1/SenC/PrrC family)
MKRFLFTATLAQLLFFLACATTSSDAQKNPKTSEVAAVSRPMPAFSLTQAGGGSLASAELAGKPLMVNFWHPS